MYFKAIGGFRNFMSELQTCYSCGEDKDLSLFTHRLGIPFISCKMCVQEAKEGKRINDFGQKKRNALRKKRLKQATPNWLTKEDKKKMKAMQQVAKENNLTLDHIVPLAGRNVSGLNVPWNLQFLSFSENSKKYNSF